MRLNPDCMRNILLTIEEFTDDETTFEYNRFGEIPKRLEKYSHSEIHYHFQQCSMSELIVGFRRYDAGNLITVADLSPKGHEFLANIRQDNIWNNTKSIAAKVGSTSLNALIQISTNVITELIKAQFGLI